MEKQRILDRETMRDLDRRAIEEYGIPGLLLMENAGRGATDVACGMLGRPPGAWVSIVCGKGNNGGDGFVVARHLHNRGYRPEIVFLGDPKTIPAGTDAGVNALIARRMGIPATWLRGDKDLLALEASLSNADLVVDAIFGTGLSGPVRGLACGVIEAVNAADRPVLAIDIPSGIDANTGELLGTAIRARETATFGTSKPGLHAGAGAEHAGRVTVVEISIPRELIEGA